MLKIKIGKNVVRDEEDEEMEKAPKILLRKPKPKPKPPAKLVKLKLVGKHSGTTTFNGRRLQKPEFGEDDLDYDPSLDPEAMNDEEEWTPDQDPDYVSPAKKAKKRKPKSAQKPSKSHQAAYSSRPPPKRQKMTSTSQSAMSKLKNRFLTKASGPKFGTNVHHATTATAASLASTKKPLSPASSGSSFYSDEENAVEAPPKQVVNTSTVKPISTPSSTVEKPAETIEKEPPSNIENKPAAAAEDSSVSMVPIPKAPMHIAAAPIYKKPDVTKEAEKVEIDVDAWDDLSDSDEEAAKPAVTNTEDSLWKAALSQQQLQQEKETQRLQQEEELMKDRERKLEMHRIETIELSRQMEEQQRLDAERQKDSQQAEEAQRELLRAAARAEREKMQQTVDLDEQRKLMASADLEDDDDDDDDEFAFG